MSEDHFDEIERLLLYISEARERAEKARAELERAGAEPHLIQAVTVAEAALKAEHRRLMQSTYYAVRDQEQLAV